MSLHFRIVVYMVAMSTAAVLAREKLWWNPYQCGNIWPVVTLALFGMDTTPRGRSLRRHQARYRAGFVSVLHIINFWCTIFFSDFLFYSVSVRFWRLCSIAIRVVKHLCVDCSCNITWAIDKYIQRDGDDDDSEQKMMNEYLAKRKGKEIVRLAKKKLLSQYNWSPIKRKKQPYIITHLTRRQWVFQWHKRLHCVHWQTHCNTFKYRCVDDDRTCNTSFDGSAVYSIVTGISNAFQWYMIWPWVCTWRRCKQPEIVTTN